MEKCLDFYIDEVQVSKEEYLMLADKWIAEYEKASYPVRDKKEVKLFDVREFVKNMKKEQMSQMFGDMNGPSGNPLPFGLPNMANNAMPNPFMGPVMQLSNQYIGQVFSQDKTPNSLYNEFSLNNGLKPL